MMRVCARAIFKLNLNTKQLMRYFTFYFYNFAKLCSVRPKMQWTRQLRSCLVLRINSAEYSLFIYSGHCILDTRDYGCWEMGPASHVIGPLPSGPFIDSVFMRYNQWCAEWIPFSNDDDWRTRFNWIENILITRFFRMVKFRSCGARLRCAPTRSKRQLISISEAFQNK